MNRRAGTEEYSLLKSHGIHDVLTVFADTVSQMIFRRLFTLRDLS